MSSMACLCGHSIKIFEEPDPRLFVIPGAWFQEFINQASKLRQSAVNIDRHNQWITKNRISATIWRKHSRGTGGARRVRPSTKF